MCKVTYYNWNTKLIGKLFQLLEVLDEARIVAVATGVEAVPYGSEDSCASESVVLYLSDVVLVDTSQGDDFLVDDACLVGLLNFLRCVVGVVALFRDAVEHGAEEYIVASFLAFLHFFQCMAGVYVFESIVTL